MSLYLDIYNDFPLRCAKVWETLRGQARTEGLDVTLRVTFWRKDYLGVASPFPREMAAQCDAVVNGVGH